MNRTNIAIFLLCLAVIGYHYWPKALQEGVALAPYEGPEWSVARLPLEVWDALDEGKDVYWEFTPYVSKDLSVNGTTYSNSVPVTSEDLKDK